MIVNIRGANGAGKSTIVRRLLKGWAGKPVFYHGRRNPDYIVYGDLAVLGHYGIKNGGVDTLRYDIHMVYDLIRRLARSAPNLLFEGKNQSRDKELLLSLNERTPVCVVHVHLPLEECIMAVRERGHTLSADSIGRTWYKMERDADWLEKNGVSVLRVGRDAAVTEIRRLLPCLSS